MAEHHICLFLNELEHNAPDLWPALIVQRLEFELMFYANPEPDVKGEERQRRQDIAVRIRRARREIVHWMAEQLAQKRESPEGKLKAKAREVLRAVVRNREMSGLDLLLLLLENPPGYRLVDAGAIDELAEHLDFHWSAWD